MASPPGLTVAQSPPPVKCPSVILDSLFKYQSITPLSTRLHNINISVHHHHPLLPSCHPCPLAAPRPFQHTLENCTVYIYYLFHSLFPQILLPPPTSVFPPSISAPFSCSAPWIWKCPLLALGARRVPPPGHWITLQVPIQTENAPLQNCLPTLIISGSVWNTWLLLAFVYIVFWFYLFSCWQSLNVCFENLFLSL